MHPDNVLTREELEAEVNRLSSELRDCERYRVLFDDSPEAILFTNHDGMVLDANRTATVLFGFSHPEFLSHTCWEMFDDHIAGRLPHLLRDERRYNGIVLATILQRNDGSSFQAEVLTRLIEIDGELFRWVVIHDLSGVHDDASDHIIEDNQLRGMKKDSPDIFGEPDMVLLAGGDGYITSASRLFFETARYSWEDLKRGLPVATILLVEGVRSGKHFLRTLARMTDCGPIEADCRKSDGSFFPVLVSLGKMEEDHGMQQYRVFLIDMTDHKRAERHLANLERMQALGELSGGVLHDLNNIFTLIQGYLDRIESDTDLRGPQSATLFEQMQTVAGDGVRILQRLRTGQDESVDGKRLLLDLQSLIGQTITLVMSRAELNKEGISVVTQLNPVPPLRGNATELREVFTNILVNAVQAMPLGGTITIMTETTDEAVLIRFSDTGIGMDEKTRSMLFDPFFTTKEENGTGLGMSISKGIVEAHGGHIAVESTQGQGSVISVYLPVYYGSAEQPISPRGDDLSVLDGLSVLIIEDDPGVRDVFVNLLERHGCLVGAAGDGEEGLALFVKTPAVVVITDLHLPDISGVEVSAKIKALRPETVVVLCSGAVEHSAPNDVVSFDAVISKPIDFTAFVQTIRSLAERSS